jgi:hypothetical protein
LKLQANGDLVLSKAGAGAFWDTQTRGATTLSMQGDGNLVLYSIDDYTTPSGHSVGDTGTDGHPGARLAIQDDGNLVVYDGTDALWASDTAGK